MQSQELESAMRQLRAEYQRGLPEQVEEMARVWRALVTKQWSAVEFRGFIRSAHQLAGSGATYGMIEVSQAARTLQSYAKKLDATVRPTPEQCANLEGLLAQLRKAVKVQCKNPSG